MGADVDEHTATFQRREESRAHVALVDPRFLIARVGAQEWDSLRGFACRFSENRLEAS